MAVVRVTKMTIAQARRITINPITVPIITRLAVAARSSSAEVAAMIPLKMIIATAMSAIIPKTQRRMFNVVSFRSALPSPSWPPTDSMLKVVAASTGWVTRVNPSRAMRLIINLLRQGDMFFSVEINAATRADTGSMEPFGRNVNLLASRNDLVLAVQFNIQLSFQHVENDVVRVVMGRVDGSSFIMADMDMVKTGRFIFL